MSFPSSPLYSILSTNFTMLLSDLARSFVEFPRRESPKLISLNTPRKSFTASLFNSAFLLK